jgi:T5SS/PEP-CTERM-associated repeat protein
VPPTAQGQLVADGQTNVLDGVTTNVTGGIIIGTNESFTLLVVTNGAVVSNSGGNAMIGYNAPAQSNRVVVVGGGSSWNCGGSLVVGQSGSASELDILNGGVVTDSYGYLGWVSGSSGNLVLVSGAGSVWTNSSNLWMGYGGSRNALIITNGGHVFSGGGTSYIAEGPSSVSNSVLITGAGSSWNCGSYFYLGSLNPGMNQLTINSGGAFVTSNTCDIGAYANSNILTVADSGSSLQCQTFRMGYMGKANQCIVSNGAKFAVTGNMIDPTAATMEGTFSQIIITGAGSVWTNGGTFIFGQSSNALLVTSGGMLVDVTGAIALPGGSGGGGALYNTATVSGPNSLWNNLGDLYVAENNAQLFITNGGTVADYYGYFGDIIINTGSTNCHALVSGPGSLWTNRNDLYIGHNGTSNRLVVTDSGLVKANNLYIGYTGNRNQMTVSNSGTVIANSLQISGGNLVTITGGTVIVSNAATLMSYGTLALNSGFFRANFLTAYGGDDTNMITFNSGTLQSGGTSYGNAAPFKVGDGTNAAIFQMLDQTTPNGGTHTFSGGLLISSNALLTGSGTVNGNVFVGNGGTFAPGSTNVWLVTATGSLVLSNGCTTVMGLQPLSNATYSVRGLASVTYGGTLQLTNLGGTFASEQSYQLFYASQYNGAFSNLTPATPGNGLRWDTNQLNIDGTLRVFSAVTPPPVFGNVTVTDGNLTMTATGGIPYDPCYLLTATNLIVPLTNWTYVDTNYFDVTGTVNLTNTIQAGEAQQYFRLQLN